MGVIREFRLGDWRVKPQFDELVGPGGPVSVQAPSMQVLVALAQRADEVVAREDLLSEVWGDAFVEEQVLTHAIWDLRRALGDDSKEPRFIQTLPRKGYRLIAPVSWLDMAAGPTSHYKLVERVGKGGMGVVFKARDTIIRRTVAVKFLPDEVSRDSSAKERFLREARMAGRLDHPNLCPIYDAGETDDGRLFLVMPFYEGKTLRQWEQDRRPTLEEALDLAVQIASGLACLHEEGIVHRDLNPANVMLDAKGQPRILDFGLAKRHALEETAGATKLTTELMTRQGTVLGTFPYMSPEQAEGKPIDHRSDIFSFGVLLYEMVAGQRPFIADSAAALIGAILKDTPQPLRETRPDLPESLGAIVSRCIEKDPEDRYQRAADVKGDLADLQRSPQPGIADSEPDQGADPTVRPAASTRRRWVLAATGALALLAVLFALQLTPSEEEASVAESEPRFSSLAVLPLENRSGDPEQDYFSDGLTEALIAELGRISALRVISRQSVMRYKDSDKPLPEIAKDLGVEAFIEGSVLSVGDRVRITARLVQAAPEKHLWVDTYERRASDVLHLLNEVTRAIASEVRVVVSPAQEALLAKSAPVDPKAHRAYLRGQSALRPRRLESAGQHFREALRIEPEYALAWTGLASYHLALEVWGLPWGAEDRRRENSLQAQAALAKALALDDSSARVHILIGWSEWLSNWDWAKAENEFQEALRLNPNDAEARETYAHFLTSMGRHEEAAQQLVVAEQLDPFSTHVHRTWGDAHYYARNFELSIRRYDRVFELDSGATFSLAMKGFPLVAMGRTDEAVNVWKTYRRAIGQHELAASYEGKTYEEVCRLFLEAAKDPSHPGSGPSVLAQTYALIGEYEEALKWLEEGYATKGDPGKTAGSMFPFLKVEPLYEPLHSDPRFQDLLIRMNLVD